jgi:hypothetical protein
MSDGKLLRWGILTGAMLGILAGVASAGLVAQYKLDETSGLTAADSSGKHNDATIAGTPTWVAGKFGGAMQFSGSSPVTLPAANLAMTSTMGSAAFWMKADAGTAGTIRTMFWAGDNTTGTGFGAENEIHVHIEGSVANIWRGGELSFFILGGVAIHSDPTKGAAGNVPVNPALVNDNQWHHVAAVWDATSGKLYLDGSLISQATYTSTGFALSNMCLGKMVSGNRQYNGILDDVQIYNHALSDAGVRTAMLGGVEEGPAMSPVPEDSAADVLRDVVLKWKAGPFVGTHDVYLGTVFDDVNTADRSNAKGVLVSRGQDANTYDPANLQFGQTYYWRVDEVNVPPSTKIFKGKVWSFAVEPYAYKIPSTLVTATASGNDKNAGPENTVNGSGLDAGDLHGTTTTTMWAATSPAWIQFTFDRTYKLYQLWIWNHNSDFEGQLGLGIKDATIEYSTNGTDWTTLGDYQFAQAQGSAGYAHNTTVDLAGIAARQVRITAKSGWGVTAKRGLSEVRFFYVPVWAREPSPAAGAANVAVDAALSWRPGREVDYHRVYTGTDPNALTLAGTVTAGSYAPGNLALGTRYYWKVNEVNGAGVWQGDVWSFSTPESIVVDDMESYNDKAGTSIFNTWIDGYNTQDNGAQVGYSDPANGTFCDTTIIHGGRQSMPFLYDNSSKVNSEATRTFDPMQDWTLGNAKTLVIYFRGNAANTTGQLFAKINGTKVNYSGGAAAQTSTVWKPWNIDLTAIGGLKAVKTLTIGISGTGKGTLYIDDIRLYRSPVAVATPVDPGTTGLMAYYTMENDAKDTKGGYNGTLNTVTFADSMAGFGKAAVFNGTTGYIDLGASFGSGVVSKLSSCTFTAWVNYTGTGAIWQRVFDFGSSTTAYVFLSTRNATSYPRFAIIGLGKAEVGAADSKVMSLGWHHLAGVIDASTMKMALYVDGNLAQGDVATTVLPKDLGSTTQNWIGRSMWSADPYLNGSVDDLKIFNRALTAGEIGYLAGDR